MRRACVFLYAVISVNIALTPRMTALTFQVRGIFHGFALNAAVLTTVTGLAAARRMRTFFVFCRRHGPSKVSTRTGVGEVTV
jgi:hypothetical protein